MSKNTFFSLANVTGEQLTHEKKRHFYLFCKYTCNCNMGRDFVIRRYNNTPIAFCTKERDNTE